MANDNFPRGLVPLNFNPKSHANYYKVSTAADIWLGEPVVLSASGYVVAGSITGYIQYLGVAVGFAGVKKTGLATDDPFLDVSDLPGNFGSGDRYVLVADRPDQEFYIQADTGGSALTQAAAGTAIDGIYRGATGTVRDGNTTSGWANLELDRSTTVSTLSSPLQLLRLHDNVNTDGSDNDVSANFEKWVVKIVNHQKAGGTLPVTGVIV